MGDSEWNKIMRSRFNRLILVRKSLDSLYNFILERLEKYGEHDKFNPFGDWWMAGVLFQSAAEQGLKFLIAYYLETKEKVKKEIPEHGKLAHDLLHLWGLVRKHDPENICYGIDQSYREEVKASFHAVYLGAGGNPHIEQALEKMGRGIDRRYSPGERYDTKTLLLVEERAACRHILRGVEAAGSRRWPEFPLTINPSTLVDGNQLGERKQNE